ncbi:hypothetical protein [Nocardioides sp. Arc9.136]|uniref:hypothetical protein n=1 Tax=Nocardioides sp. Arc9.136 TaxID=2996826 RepID=UPI0026652A5C|nr:hypothetical protein [Nocardioides sp. Arc9.136]WKN47145.1 hypothetical protein OSR43_13965 [Nocardioides sp. Arc9.136]
MPEPTFDYDPATPEGLVRLLLNDVDEDTAVFTDVEIAAFLTLEGGSVKRAAAQAIDVNATDQALASKVLKTASVVTDGAKLADAMRKHAAALRDQADREDDAADGDYFDVIDLEGGVDRPERTAWPC